MIIFLGPIQQTQTTYYYYGSVCDSKYYKQCSVSHEQEEPLNIVSVTTLFMTNMVDHPIKRKPTPKKHK